MIKISSIFYFLLFCLLVSCETKRSVKTTLMKDEPIVDSFFVSGFEELPNDLSKYQYINDSIGIGSSDFKIIQIFKSTTDQPKHFKLERKSVGLPGIDDYLISFLAGRMENGQLRLFASPYLGKEIVVYDEFFKEIKRSPLSVKLPFIQDRYTLVTSANTYLGHFVGDTLLAPLSTSKYEWLKDLDKVPGMMSFLIENDSVSFLKNFGLIATNARDYYYGLPAYTYGGGKVWSLYTAWDTIYSYEIKTGKVIKIPIKNPYYTPSTKWVDTIPNDPELFTKLNKYLRSNFRYELISYNTRTKHIVVDYTLPHKLKVKDGLIEESQNMSFLMILDENGKILRRINIDNTLYDYPLIQTPKGIAIPRTPSKNADHETVVRFDIFNF